MQRTKVTGKVKDFDAADGRDMFCDVADDVCSSPEHRTTMTGCLDVLNAVDLEVTSAGCVPVFVLLSPDVGTCLRAAGCVVPECLGLPVHPSGARGVGGAASGTGAGADKAAYD